MNTNSTNDIMTVRVSVAEEAHNIIHGDRRATYGTPTSSFEQIAALWEAYLKRRKDGPLDAQDVANMMILMKVSRDAMEYLRDNVVDIIGYAMLKEEMHDIQQANTLLQVLLI